MVQFRPQRGLEPFSRSSLCAERRLRGALIHQVQLVAALLLDRRRVGGILANLRTVRWLRLSVFFESLHIPSNMRWRGGVTSCF